MKTYFFIMIALIGMIACDKDEDFAENYSDKTITWTIGPQHSSDTMVRLPASSGTVNYLSVENYSICPNTRLKIIVHQNDQIILDSIYQDNFTRYVLSSQPGDKITVETRLVEGDNLVLCAWLGEATLKYEYLPW